eukprot:gene109-3501_t
MYHDEDEEDRSYYHGRIPRDEAIRRLQEDGRDGAFLLRMSETQDGVYTISLLQGTAVRHIRVVNQPDGTYSLSQSDIGEASVWELISNQMNKALRNCFDSFDSVALRFPVEAPGSVIAPDLLCKAEEAGMDASEFDLDVAAFLEGGVDSKELVRRRSKKYSMKKSSRADEVSPLDEDVERFVNGAMSAKELQRRRSVSKFPQ